MEGQLNRAAWVEIDLGALRHNFRVIRRRLGPDVRMICVVKSEAYGHGAAECSRVLAQEGADMLAVATFDEFYRLRAEGIGLPILVLGHVPEYCYEEMIALDGSFALYSAAQAKALDDAAARVGKNARVQVKVDTGLSRLGFAVSEEAAAECALACALPHLTVQAVYSHFAASDELDKEYTFFQHSNFLQFIWLCQRQGLTFPWRHIANSAAICDLPAMWHEGVRPGIILYGGYPSTEVERLDLRPVMSVKAQVVNLRDIQPDTAVSYGCLWHAQRPSRIALLPLGYADGINRLLAGQIDVLLHGRRVPQLGKVCMDQIMVDVTDIPEVRLGDEAVVVGSQGRESIEIDELAHKIPTINYELLCGFHFRLPQIYLDRE